ncbi:hypothetical protein KSP39_PZI014367 [Platanthera zijinensis]|uniref:DUF8040 domain-containing protein n=1 Tax=Platanthera zijinensis TaxID=2320716 RepID=A0AAP0G204_9ASPA
MIIPGGGGSWCRLILPLRMSKRIFVDLLRKLEVDHELQGSQRTSSGEVLGIKLYILAQGGSLRLTKERFQHSTETISRYFSAGLKSLLLLSVDVIKPIDRQFRDIPAEIRYDPRYMPFFKDCVGAIDGTHVDARIPVEDQGYSIGRVCVRLMVLIYAVRKISSQIPWLAMEEKELVQEVLPHQEWFLKSRYIHSSTTLVESKRFPRSNSNFLTVTVEVTEKPKPAVGNGKEAHHSLSGRNSGPPPLLSLWVDPKIHLE